MKIPALTLWEPWATLIALADHPDPEIRALAKHFETRNWDTQYRGVIAIHSARIMPTEGYRALSREPFRTVLAKAGLNNARDLLPRGVVVAIVKLVDVFRVDLVGKNFILEKGHKSRIIPLLSEYELAFGDFSPGRYVWKLDNVHRLSRPVPAKGNRLLWWWDVPEELTKEVLSVKTA